MPLRRDFGCRGPACHDHPVSDMPQFHYRALTQNGEIVSGSISAPTAGEVARRVEYLGLVPIETAAEQGAAAVSRLTLAFVNKPRAEDVTVFTRDLALLLRAGARLDDGLELLASDVDIGRLRPIVGRIRAGILAGESFAEVITRWPELFPAVYVALVRVGEASGTSITFSKCSRPSDCGRERSGASWSMPCNIRFSCCWRRVACWCFFFCSCCRNSLQCCAISMRSSIRLLRPSSIFRISCARIRLSSSSV